MPPVISNQLDASSRTHLPQTYQRPTKTAQGSPTPIFSTCRATCPSPLLQAQNIHGAHSLVSNPSHPIHSAGSVHVTLSELVVRSWVSSSPDIDIDPGSASDSSSGLGEPRGNKSSRDSLPAVRMVVLRWIAACSATHLLSHSRCNCASSYDL